MEDGKVSCALVALLTPALWIKSNACWRSVKGCVVLHGTDEHPRPQPGEHAEYAYEGIGRQRVGTTSRRLSHPAVLAR